MPDLSETERQVYVAVMDLAMEENFRGLEVVDDQSARFQNAITAHFPRMKFDGESDTVNEFRTPATATRFTDQTPTDIESEDVPMSLGDTKFLGFRLSKDRRYTQPVNFVAEASYQQGRDWYKDKDSLIINAHEDQASSIASPKTAITVDTVSLVASTGNSPTNGKDGKHWREPANRLLLFDAINEAYVELLREGLTGPRGGMPYIITSPECWGGMRRFLTFDARNMGVGNLVDEAYLGFLPNFLGIPVLHDPNVAALGAGSAAKGDKIYMGVMGQTIRYGQKIVQPLMYWNEVRAAAEEWYEFRRYGVQRAYDQKVRVIEFQNVT